MTDPGDVSTSAGDSSTGGATVGGGPVAEGPVGEERSLFVPDGEGWLPTALSRGPWDPNSLHGGPVAALMTRAVEQMEAPIPARLARITVELLRPVPVTPLLVETALIRPGAKVSTVEVTLRLAHDLAVIAIARAQRIRVAAVEFPDGSQDEVPDFPPDLSEIEHWPGAADVTFHANAVEHRFLRGSFSEVGPTFDWMRLAVPVVPGEVATGWQRAVACADFTNGISSVAPFDGRSTFINPDLTVHLWREPVGEWIGSDAVTRTSADGIGLAETAMWDRSGRVGRGLQSLYLQRD
jgi:hypothetical protein